MKPNQRQPMQPNQRQPMRPTQEELNEILSRWVTAPASPRRDLRGANLRGANLQDANLRGANLWHTDLRGANLRGADLRNAYLWHTDLRGAYLRGADLRDANLQNANLRGAKLQDANLRGADLRNADLQNAYLRDANLQNACLPPFQIPQEGDLIVWKKLRAGALCKLRIPDGARRTASLVGRKCRAERAVVLEGSGTSQHDRTFRYVEGATLVEEDYDGNPAIECAPGIHFFLTREEAAAY